MRGMGESLSSLVRPAVDSTTTKLTSSHPLLQGNKSYQLHQGKFPHNLYRELVLPLSPKYLVSSSAPRFIVEPPASR